jgi:hypothetical protein
MGDAKSHAFSESRVLASIEPAAPVEVKDVAALGFPRFRCALRTTQAGKPGGRTADRSALTGR